MSKIYTKEENQAWQRKLPQKKSSACVAFVENNKVLMVKATYKAEWTFPGGAVEDNESPKEAAIREAYEEVGIASNSDNVSLLTVIYSRGKDGWLDRYNFVFVNNKHDRSTKLTLADDEIELAEWVDFNDIAKRANLRGSYIKIQELLLSPENDEVYSEIL